MVPSTLRNTALAFAVCLIASAQEKPQKQWVNEGEQNLVTSLAKETTPAARLAKLEEWSKNYPQTAFAAERQQEYLVVYEQLNRPRERFDMALEILKRDPNDFQALRSIVISIYQGTPTPADFDAAEKTCRYILANADVIFAADKKPAGMTDDWTQVKRQIHLVAQRTLGVIAVTQKDNEKAEVEFTNSLQLDPTQAQISQLLAGAILAQNKTKPEKQQFAIFHYARAASYTGPGAIDAAARTKLQEFVTKAYNTYHGSESGLDEVFALAKTNALPPPHFAIKDAATIEREKPKVCYHPANPAMAMWCTIKTELTSENSDAFFADRIKDFALPKFKGTLVSIKPAIRPKQLLIAVEKPGVADCTLNLDEGQVLPGKMEPGAEIEFEGTGTAYTKEPYMLTLTVDKTKISGWKPVAAPPAPKKAGVKKRAE